jgi:hypothetical protein
MIVTRRVSRSKRMGDGSFDKTIVTTLALACRRMDIKGKGSGYAPRRLIQERRAWTMSESKTQHHLHLHIRGQSSQVQQGLWAWKKAS